MWKDKTEQLLAQVTRGISFFSQNSRSVEFRRNTDGSVLISVPTQVSLVAEERDQNINRVQELEAAVAELKNTAG